MTILGWLVVGFALGWVAAALCSAAARADRQAEREWQALLWDEPN